MNLVDYLIPAGAAAVAFLLGFLLHRMLVAREIKGAEAESERIIHDARREAETIKREAVLEGRDSISRERFLRPL